MWPTRIDFQLFVAMKQGRAEEVEKLREEQRNLEKRTETIRAAVVELGAVGTLIAGAKSVGIICVALESLGEPSRPFSGGEIVALYREAEQIAQVFERKIKVALNGTDAPGAVIADEERETLPRGGSDSVAAIASKLDSDCQRALDLIEGLIDVAGAAPAGGRAAGILIDHLHDQAGYINGGVSRLWERLRPLHLRVVYPEGVFAIPQLPRTMKAPSLNMLDAFTYCQCLVEQFLSELQPVMRYLPEPAPHNQIGFREAFPPRWHECAAAIKAAHHWLPVANYPDLRLCLDILAARCCGNDGWSQWAARGSDPADAPDADPLDLALLAAADLAECIELIQHAVDRPYLSDGAAASFRRAVFYDLEVKRQALATAIAPVRGRLIRGCAANLACQDAAKAAESECVHTALLSVAQDIQERWTHGLRNAAGDTSAKGYLRIIEHYGEIPLVDVPHLMALATTEKMIAEEGDADEAAGMVTTAPSTSTNEQPAPARDQAEPPKTYLSTSPTASDRVATPKSPIAPSTTAAPTALDMSEGEWLVPGLSLKNLANRLGNVGNRKAKTMLKPFGLCPFGSTGQLWTVRLDKMYPNMREMIEGRRRAGREE